MRFAGDDHIAHFGEGLRNLVLSLDDDCSLLFLCRVSEDFEDDVRAYEVTVLGKMLRVAVELRSGEMTALEWTDIDFRRNQLHVNRAQWEEHVDTPKGGKARTLPMTVGWPPH